MKLPPVVAGLASTLAVIVVIAAPRMFGMSVGIPRFLVSVTAGLLAFALVSAAAIASGQVEEARAGENFGHGYVLAAGMLIALLVLLLPLAFA